MKVRQLFISSFLLVCIILLSGCGSVSATFYDVDEVLYKGEFKNVEEMLAYTPTIEGYTFNYWEVNGKKVEAANLKGSSFELIANTTINTYTYKFVNDDGTVISEGILEYGEQIPYPKDKPTKPSDSEYSYNFISWDKKVGTIEKDIVFTAQYNQELLCTIQFMYNGEAVHTQKAGIGEKIEPYTFSDTTSHYQVSPYEWYTDEALTKKYNFEQGVSGSVMLYPKLKKERTDLEGAKISILGDSLSTFYADGSAMNSYYGGNDQFYYPKYSSTIKTVEKTWWAQMLSLTNTKLGINESLSGSTCYNFGSSTDTQAAMNQGRINHLGENGDPDIIIVFIGVNDNVNGFSTANFKSAYKTMLERIQATYPGAKIFLCNHSYSAYHTTASHYYYSEETRLAYNQIISEMCTEYNCELVDFASVITSSNYSANLGDNLHYNYAGATKLAEKIAQVLKDYYKK